MIAFETAMIANLFSAVLFVINHLQLKNEIRNLKEDLTSRIHRCGRCDYESTAYEIDIIKGRCRDEAACDESYTLTLESDVQ